MRIAYVAAGAGGMYCGSCLRDNTLAASLISEGHEVTLIPTYSPLRTDEPGVGLDRLFYGAINVYLQQRSALFRRSPRILDRLLDGRRLLEWAFRFATSTEARDLGALTLSVLRGELGRQHKELDRLADFVASLQPQVVQLTNAMFLGIGSALRRRLGVPVVSGLTGEDIFLQDLPEPYRSDVRRELVNQAKGVDAFVATSRYYAAEMQSFLEVSTERMHVVPLGISLEGYRPRTPRRETQRPPTLGYLARICPEKGLHLLCEAFRLVKETEEGVPLRLAIAGYLGSRDRRYFEEQRRFLRRHGLEDSVTFVGEIDRVRKLKLLHDLDILSVPTTYRESKGLYVLEAWAAGVPVVQPRHGSFPELVEESGGGLLVEPDSPEDLARGVLELVRDPERRLELGAKGRAAVEQTFNARQMARRMAAIYELLIAPAADNHEESNHD